jgi:hypothetical protein
MNSCLCVVLLEIYEMYAWASLVVSSGLLGWNGCCNTAPRREIARSNLVGLGVFVLRVFAVSETDAKCALMLPPPFFLYELV